MPAAWSSTSVSSSEKSGLVWEGGRARSSWSMSPHRRVTVDPMWPRTRLRSCERGCAPHRRGRLRLRRGSRWPCTGGGRGSRTAALRLRRRPGSRRGRASHVPVRAAHDKVRRRLRERCSTRRNEFDERPHDHSRPCRDQDPASCLGDHPPGHGRVDVPIAEHVREQAGEGLAERGSPRHTHDKRPVPADPGGRW